MQPKRKRVSLRLPDDIDDFIKNTPIKAANNYSLKIFHLTRLGIEVFDIIDAIRANRKMLKQEQKEIL